MEYAKSLSSAEDASRHQGLRETNRLFHNFLAGAMTLVDHTRVLVSEFYRGTEVNKEFKRRVDSDFATNPLTRFVQDLRNYMIHRGNLPLERHLTMKPLEGGEPNQVTATTGLQLDVQQLREWKGWKLDAKKYLEAAGNKINLLELIENYRALVQKFREEFDQVLTDHHKSDLDYLHAMQAAFQANRTRLG